MKLKEELFNTLIKEGYSKNNGKKVWDMAERRFLYMTPELARSFLNLRKFPAYKKQIFDREVALIRANGDTISKIIGVEPFNLIDIYCGDGTKAAELIKSINTDSHIRYSPVNVSNFLTSTAVKNMKKSKFESVGKYLPIISDGDAYVVKKEIKKLRDSTYRRSVILLLGSVLSSYEINDYLYELNRGMKKGDILIIGNGVRQGKRLAHLEIYKHKIWHQWFVNLVKELGIQENEVEYDARFNNVRVEAFYRMKNDKVLSGAGKKISLNRGDEILVAFLYKYFPHEFDKFCSMYFSEVKTFLDRDNEYALVVCKK